MNRYNYLTFRPRHQRERRTLLKQRHHNQTTTNRKPEGSFFPKNWPYGYPKIKIPPIHAKTYTDRNSKPQNKHRLGTVSKKTLPFEWAGGGAGGGGKGCLNRLYVATTLGLSYKTFVQSA